jgi:hypothetical protein
MQAAAMNGWMPLEELSVLHEVRLGSGYDCGVVLSETTRLKVEFDQTFVYKIEVVFASQSNPHVKVLTVSQAGIEQADSLEAFRLHKHRRRMVERSLRQQCVVNPALQARPDLGNYAVCCTVYYVMATADCANVVSKRLHSSQLQSELVGQPLVVIIEKSEIFTDGMRDRRIPRTASAVPSREASSATITSRSSIVWRSAL